MARLLLEIVEGPGAGRQLPLERPVVVGRDAAADVVLDDERVSRQHARITPQAGGAVVEDLDSRNGTFVNREEIHSPVTALPGDDVLLGTTVLELRTDAELATRPSVVRPVPPALAAATRAPDYLAPSSPVGAPERSARPPAEDRLAAYFDTRTKAQARLAPVAIFLLVALVVIVYLALR
jgi:pSer/pThr/pTyr-binding forkhead associated (FHA) protein